MVIIDRVVCEVESQVEVSKSVTCCPGPYELVGRPLLDCDQSTPKLGTLLFIVVKVPWYFFAVVITRALVGCKFLRTDLLFSCLQIWQHAEVALFQFAIAIDETPKQNKNDSKVSK